MSRTCSRSALAATSPRASGRSGSRTATPCGSAAGAASRWTRPDMATRLRERYKTEVVPALMRDQGYTNLLEVPRLEKIVLNMGLGEAVQNPKLIDVAVDEMTAIAGQKPVVTRARKAISNFKLREKVAIGVMVTLRGERMYEFLDRFVSAAL